MFEKIAGGVVLMFCITESVSADEQGGRIELGRAQTGSTVSFQVTSNGWGIDISGAHSPKIFQLKPAQIEVYHSDEDIRPLAAGYKTARKTDSGVDADAEISDGDVTFRVHDHWSLIDAQLSVNRRVEVSGNAPGGFYSSVILMVDPELTWTNISYLVPGVLYGDPTYDGNGSPGSAANYNARRLLLREDILSAPLFALSFSNGASVSVLDPAPRGDTTEEETRLEKPVLTDDRLRFGALGAWQNQAGAVEFGFRYPGTTDSIGGRGTTASVRRVIRRYHPIKQGVAHSYSVSFRFGENESFRDVTKNSWRWAWNKLNPPVNYIDVEEMRRVLIDHLEAQANTIDGRTAIPFAVLSIPTNQVQWNYTMVAMGFVGKNIECADQLLREGDRDKSERGQKMRKTGLSIISSLIQALPTVPLQGAGYDLATGKPWTGDHQEWVAPWLRNATEDMRVLMRAYRRERALGRSHPEWFNWVKQYADWLILQQRSDGSFPRCWKPGSSEVEESTATSSYCPVPLLVMMSEETGDAKYQQAAVRAAECVWSNWGNRGLYIGGAIDNPNITDKEAGMLSMEAFLSLYDFTKDPKWLGRAESAATFAESWIWIWNVPMPLDADDSQLSWKKSAPALGFQGITAAGAGSVDEYLDWAVPSYAKLYKLTRDSHYLDVARVLLHDTKTMVAMPGRQYDMRAIGFQQEGWRMGPGGGGRGSSGHRFWLPWISANHLYGITGLEEYDSDLYTLIGTKPVSR
jgi:hypothetical protein